MKDLSGEQTLFAALPIILILIALVGALVFAQNGIFEVRSKAAPLPTPTLAQVTIQPRLTPEVFCSELYDPVCGQNGTTFSNDCEATQAGVTIVYRGACANIPQQLPSGY